VRNIEHALIMAAGRGVRMEPLTSVIPKPMIPYQGSTLISNGIKKVRAHISHVHITVGYKGALLAEHVIQQGVSSVFNTEGKGNAWWIYNTFMKFLPEPAFVLTCDNVCELDFTQLAAEYFDAGAPACMVVPIKPVEGLDGDFIFCDEQQVIHKIDRKEKSDLYCTGIQILNTARVNEITEPCDDFYGVWSQLIAQREMVCSRIQPKKWFTVDTLDKLTQLNNEDSSPIL
jgi:NDP-sugar pyrophosphorylase family protein